MKETWKHTLTACSLKLATDFMKNEKYLLSVHIALFYWASPLIYHCLQCILFMSAALYGLINICLIMWWCMPSVFWSPSTYGSCNAIKCHAEWNCQYWFSLMCVWGFMILHPVQCWMETDTTACKIFIASLVKKSWVVFFFRVGVGWSDTVTGGGGLVGWSDTVTGGGGVKWHS